MWKIAVVLLMLTLDNVTTSSWSVRINNILRSNQMPIYGSMEKSLSTGVRLAMEHCQRQFKWDQWNCPENVFYNGNRGWGSTKEFAYVLAITSAAIDYVVTKNCSQGSIKGCGCNPHLNGQSEGEFVWGGCSDYPEYGENASKKVLDDADTGLDAHTYTNLHNYVLGREVVRGTMKRQCKCHGMSGSCSIQSCWMQLAPFEEIAQELRLRYDRAVRIDFDDEGKFMIGNSVSGNTLSVIHKVKTSNLMYVQKSPNYCRENNTTGWKGTKRRTCSRRKGHGVSTSERKSCQNLCRKCGHQIRKVDKTVQNHCNCSFKWCCEVKCDRCTETVTEYYCS